MYFCLPCLLIVDKDSTFTRDVFQIKLRAGICKLKIIKPFNHESLRTERQIQTIGILISIQLIGKGALWPLYAAVAVY